MKTKGASCNKLLPRPIRREQSQQKLSTFGIMSDVSLSYIRYMVEQLIGQGFLERSGEYLILTLTPSGMQLLRGKVTPVLAKPMIVTKKGNFPKAQSKKRKRLGWGGYGFISAIAGEKINTCSKEKSSGLCYLWR